MIDDAYAVGPGSAADRAALVNSRRLGLSGEVT
jgi:hypothetical protein